MLDGLRGIAIILVLIYHGRTLFPQPHGALQSILYGLSARGNTGVDLFFVLSGFLITRILLNTKTSPDYFKSFYMRRVLRIFPLYYGTLIVVFLIFPSMSVGSEHSQWWFWLYLQNIPETFLPGVFSGPGHFWSLAVEEQFYMVWPLVVLLLSVPKLFKLSASIIVAAIGFRILVALSGYDPYYLTLCRMDCLAAGAIIAVILFQGRSVVTLAKPAAILAGLMIPTIAIHFVLARVVKTPVVDSLLWYTPVCILSASVLVLALASKQGDLLNKTLTTPILTVFGKYSYCLYVIHPFVYYQVQTRWPLSPFRFDHLAQAAISMALTLLFSMIIWHLYEKRFLRLKRYFTAARTAAEIKVGIAEMKGTGASD